MIGLHKCDTHMTQQYSSQETLQVKAIDGAYSMRKPPVSQTKLQRLSSSIGLLKLFCDFKHRSTYMPIRPHCHRQCLVSQHAWRRAQLFLSFACLERIILRWFLVHIHASIPDDILEGSADGFTGEAMENGDKQNILPLERGM